MIVEKKSVIRIAVLLVVIALLATPVLAESREKQITVVTGLNLCIDDVKLIPRDPNGLPVEVFAYNGTTYLPVRAVAEALGQNVAWDGKTSTVYIGEHESNDLLAKLKDLDVFYKEVTYSGIWHWKDYVTDNLGTEYESGFLIDDAGYYVYNLNQRYNSFKGLIALDEDCQNTDQKTKVKVYGDEKLLYSSPDITRGFYPEKFDIDVSGVMQLKIEHTTGWPEILMIDPSFYN